MFIPVVTSADFMAAGVHVGWEAFNRSAMPATCGHDMEVPDTML